VLRIAAARVVVPSLCMAAPIVPVRQDARRALVIPHDVHTVGLWVGGAPVLSASHRPLRRGTTLLVGHVNYAGQGNGAFYNLSQARPRALVYLADAAGRVTRWRVTALRIVSKARLPHSVFAGRLGPRRLVLVTCGGPISYVPGVGYHYRDNVIVTATPA
jgi:hypothetical protein